LLYLRTFHDSDVSNRTPHVFRSLKAVSEVNSHESGSGGGDCYPLRDGAEMAAKDCRSSNWAGKNKATLAKETVLRLHSSVRRVNLADEEDVIEIELLDKDLAIDGDDWEKEKLDGELFYF
jgi:hypothetical protein